ncbi:MAG: hypothetical protein K5908_04190 [Erysipelotrichaceae bacterium]|jgi:hypothetical protein|nr:hypothetical protein [Erysipelotrichaceae bacterium]
MAGKSSVGAMLNSLVPISQLNQGKAAKIISSLGPDDIKIIVKNNEPMAAIIPISRFSELIEAEEMMKEMNHG